MPGFLDWLADRHPIDFDEMAFRQHNIWHGQNPIAAERDPTFGMPRPSRLGFSNFDRKTIERGEKQVEKYLNQVTAQWGLHWLLLYIEPKQGSNPTDDPDKEKQVGHWGGQGTDFDIYKKMSGNIAKMKADRFIQENGLDPNSTIVYIKQGSRVHGLSVWQQLHNIGHAVFSNNTKIRDVLLKKIQDAVREYQQRLYDSNPDSPPPSEFEIFVTLARLLNNHSLQRVLTMQPGDLDDPRKIVNSAFNSTKELLFDLIASFLRNKGHLPLEPRGQINQAPNTMPPESKGVSRAGDMSGLKNARGEIDRYSNIRIPSGSAPVLSLDPKSQRGPTRDWAWLPMADKEAWAELSKKLDRIIYAAFKSVTYGKVGPIHATPDVLTYNP